VTMHDGDEDHRGLERRVFELEQKMIRLLTTTAVTDAHLTGLISTMDSRHKAFERGQDLILEKLKPFEGLNTQVTLFTAQNLDTRLGVLEGLKNKFTGALTLMQVLAGTGIVGGIVAIVKMLRN
jgi:hypothetical protein